MRRISIALLASLALGGSALAAEAPVFKPHCEPLAKLTAANKDAKFTKMSVGQFHFLTGFYVSSPITPEGLPPGDGALLAEIDGHPGIVWTHGHEACITIIAIGGGHGVYMPMPISAGQLAALKSVHTGKLEEPPVAPSDKPVKGELSL